MKYSVCAVFFVVRTADYICVFSEASPWRESCHGVTDEVSFFKVFDFNIDFSKCFNIDFSKCFNIDFSKWLTTVVIKDIMYMYNYRFLTEKI